MNIRFVQRWLMLLILPFVLTGNANADDVTIGYSKLRISLPIFVAQERGIFKKHGLDVKLVGYDTAQPLMQALVERKIDVGGYTAMPISFAAMQRSGAKMYFITTMVEDQKHRISYLLRKKASSSSTIKDIRDLRGKRIGILPTIAYKAWLEVILQKNGVNPSEVSIQQLEPTLQGQALASGGVDALFTNDPVATAVLAKGVGEFITNFVETPRYLGEPFAFGSFNVNKEWGDAHPRELHRLVAALDEAVRYVNSNPAQAKVTMARFIPTVFEKQIPLYPEAKYLSTRETTLSMYSALSQTYTKQGIISSPINLNGLVYRTAPAP